MTQGISQRIADIVGAWDGVTVQPHKFGGIEFRVAHREIGHLHGDRMADLLFPVKERRSLVASGRAYAHHILPDTGWVSFPIRSEHDVPAVVALLRRNYERLRGLGKRSVQRPVSRSAELLEDRSLEDLQA